MDTQRGRKLRTIAQQQMNVIQSICSPKAVIARGGPLPVDKMLIAILDTLGLVIACQHWIIEELIEGSGEEMAPTKGETEQ